MKTDGARWKELGKQREGGRAREKIKSVGLVCAKEKAKALQ